MSSNIHNNEMNVLQKNELIMLSSLAYFEYFSDFHSVKLYDERRCYTSNNATQNILKSAIF